MNTIQQLMNRMQSRDTLACCGLDPDLTRLPPSLLHSGLSDANLVRRFLKVAVDAAGPHVCAFKIQKAFFDALPDGKEILKEVVAHIHRDYPGVTAIVDFEQASLRIAHRRRPSAPAHFQVVATFLDR